MNKQSYAGFAVLFVASFLVLNCVYGYVIVFQSETNDCFFMFGRQFLLEFFDHPAGLLCYAGHFLGQFYHYRWLGALIISACISCFGVLFLRVLAKLKSTVHVSETFFPCILLLALHTSAIYVIHDTLGLCGSCGAFLGYLSFRGKLARRVYALVATSIIYFLLGGYAWFFVAWVGIFEWFDRPLRSALLFNVGYVVFSIAVALFAWRWVFLIPLRSALLWPVIAVPPLRSGLVHCSFAHVVVDCFLAFILSASLLLMPFSHRWFSGTRLASLWRARTDRWTRVALIIACPVLAILLHSIQYNAPLDTLVARHQLYKRGQWDALLEKAKEDPSGDLPLQFMTNFALQQKGRLLDEMFDYPQTWGTRGLVFNESGLAGLNPAEVDTDRGMYNSDLFYELGHISLAVKHAHNYMEGFGKRYDVLKRMAQCSMVNGNYDMASKYLNILERTLFHRRFAQRYKAMIADPHAAEREFGDLRKCLPTRSSRHPVMHFLMLLDVKSDNRMAFDYRTAWLLLDKSKISLATIGVKIESFKRAGYTSIPTRCQEALLLWERLERTRVDLRGFSYDEATTARVEKFFQDLRHWGREDAREQLQAAYGDTYMFYYFFVVTPTDVHRIMGTRDNFGGIKREE